MAKVRLYLEGPLGEGQSVPLCTREQAHYLSGVMRLAPGDGLAVFERGVGREYAATVKEAGKRGGVLHIGGRRTGASWRCPPDLWLLFRADQRKERTDFIVEKAAEMGVRRVLPVATEFTNAGRVNRRAGCRPCGGGPPEQCGGTFCCRKVGRASAPSGGCSTTGPGSGVLMFCDRGTGGRTCGPAGKPGAMGGARRPRGRLFGGRARATPRGPLRALREARAAYPARPDTAAVAALTCSGRPGWGLVMQAGSGGALPPPFGPPKVFPGRCGAGAARFVAGRGAGSVGSSRNRRPA